MTTHENQAIYIIALDGTPFGKIINAACHLSLCFNEISTSYPLQTRSFYAEDGEFISKLSDLPLIALASPNEETMKSICQEICEKNYPVNIFSDIFYKGTPQDQEKTIKNRKFSELTIVCIATILPRSNVPEVVKSLKLIK